MSDNESEENETLPSLAVTILNDVPFEIKPNRDFWGDLANKLSTGPQGFNRIEEALKAVYSLAIKSAADSNDEEGVNLNTQNTLAVSLEELRKVFAAANTTIGDQPQDPENLVSKLLTCLCALILI